MFKLYLSLPLHGQLSFIYFGWFGGTKLVFKQWICHLCSLQKRFEPVEQRVCVNKNRCPLCTHRRTECLFLFLFDSDASCKWCAAQMSWIVYIFSPGWVIKCTVKWKYLTFNGMYLKTTVHKIYENRVKRTYQIRSTHLIQMISCPWSPAEAW